jgi:hypothetical protein
MRLSSPDAARTHAAANLSEMFRMNAAFRLAHYYLFFVFPMNLCHVFVEIFDANKTREENKHRNVPGGS